MFQGFAARQDTLLHATAIPWNLAVMKSNGVIAGSAQIKSSVTIDDALNVVTGIYGDGSNDPLNIDKLRRKNSKTAQRFFDDYRENFKKIGYDLDACKTVYSGKKSTYLNEYYHDGRTIPVTAKTAMKICPGIEERGAAVKDKVLAFVGAGRGAIKKGSCPLTTWVLVWKESLYALFEQCHKALGWSEQLLFALTFSPAESGGLGMISYHRITGMETNDTYSTITSFIQNVLGMLGQAGLSCRNSLQSAINAVYADDFEVPSAVGFISAPRAVRRTSVRDAKAPFTVMIKDYFYSETEEQIYSQARTILESEALNQSLWEVLKSYEVDIALLEELDSMMPYRELSAILSKLTACEQAWKLIPYKTRMKAIRKSRKIDQANIYGYKHRYDSGDVSKSNYLGLFKSGYGMNITASYRDSYYKFLDVLVRNHTAGCANVMLTVPADQEDAIYRVSLRNLIGTEADSLSSSWKTVESSANDLARAKKRTKNLYDARHQDVVRDQPKSSGLSDSDSDSFRGKTTLERSLKIVLAFGDHANRFGQQGDDYIAIALALNGIHPDTVNPACDRRLALKAGRSLKAASRALKTVTHESYCFNNVYATVDVAKVGKSGVDTYISSFPNMENYVSFIQTIKIAHLLEVASFGSFEDAAQHQHMVTFNKEGFVRRSDAIWRRRTSPATQDDILSDLSDEIGAIATAAGAEAKDRFSDKLSTSTSIKLAKSTSVLIKEGTIYAVDEGMSEVPDPVNMPTVAVSDMQGTVRCGKSFYPSESEYHKKRKLSLDRDLLDECPVGTRKKVRSLHREDSKLAEILVSDVLVTVRSYLARIVGAYPNKNELGYSTIPSSDFGRIQSAVRSKFDEYRSEEDLLVASFEDLFDMEGQFEYTTLDASTSRVARELLNIARGHPRNLMILCKCMKDREYVRELVVGTLANSKGGRAAHSVESSHKDLGTILLKHLDSDRDVALSNFLSEAAVTISEMHIPDFDPDKDNGHLDCFSISLATAHNAFTFDTVLSNSARRDSWFKGKVSEILAAANFKHDAECRACGIVKKFICFAWSKFSDTAALRSRELEVTSLRHWGCLVT